jgi:hypothetical protein
VRNDANELAIPLEYTGNVHSLRDDYQVNSYRVTVFNKGHLSERDIELTNELIWTYYWIKNDHRSKELYETLKRDGYIAKPFGFSKSKW